MRISSLLLLAAVVPMLSAGCAQDCVRFCERAHDELVQNFGAPEDACEDAAIVAAGNDCAACEAAFSDSFGVQAEVCDGSIIPG
jgi:hypothetical protein